MWTDGNGFFYVGDCQVGHRAATLPEITAYEAARALLVRPAPTVDDVIAVLATPQQKADIEARASGTKIAEEQVR